MTLRQDIEKAVQTAGGDAQTSAKAAIAICTLLENHIGLLGNGWFDDDDEMHALLMGPVGPGDGQ